MLGRVSQKKVEETIAWYEDYIDIRLRTGEEEEALFRRLGDPRLLAKSVLSAEEEQKEPPGKKGLLSGLLEKIRDFWNSL